MPDCPNHYCIERVGGECTHATVNPKTCHTLRLFEGSRDPDGELGLQGWVSKEMENGEKRLARKKKKESKNDEV